MSALVYGLCVAAVVASVVAMVWLRREGDRQWERVRPDRVRVTITIDTTAFVAAMGRAARSMERLGVAARSAERAMASLPCTCNDQRHDPLTALWHGSFCRWYDHDRAGHRARAAAWGWMADRLVQVGDLLGWPGGAR